MNQFAPRLPSLLHILSLVESIFRNFKCPICHHNANYSAPLKNSLLHRQTGNFNLIDKEDLLCLNKCTCSFCGYRNHVYLFKEEVALFIFGAIEQCKISQTMKKIHFQHPLCSKQQPGIIKSFFKKLFKKTMSKKH